jgi:FtsP/CotA-like multicopper oxidase with cupredoxin domain
VAFQGGTFLYHAHHHGSTFIQSAGGAAGLLIVDDAENEVPPFVSSMPETVLFIQHIHLANLNTVQNSFQTGIIQQTVTSVTEVMLVNGQHAPTLSLTAGVWNRFRIGFISDHGFFTFQFDSGSCQMQLIAKVMF